MTPLQALILGRMAEKGWDAKDVETRGIPHATLHRYMGPVRMKSAPRQQTQRQLAAALDLPLDQVYAACVATVSFTEAAEAAAPAAEAVPIRQEPPVDIFAAIDAEPRLLPEARQHLKNQVGLLLRLQALDPGALTEDPGVAAEQAVVDAGLLADLRKERKTRERRSNGSVNRRTSPVGSKAPPRTP